MSLYISVHIYSHVYIYAYAYIYEYADAYEHRYNCITVMTNHVPLFPLRAARSS